MTTKQIDLVQQTFGAVAMLPAETVGDLFYNRLFVIAPELRPLFSRTPQPEQSRKLLTMLNYIISRLDNLESLVGEVEKLALRHVRYGVKDDHYAFVGTSLLWTLEQGLGPAWTEDVKAAWIACYTLLAETMMNAAKQPVLD